jgi:hypothetical protein
VNKKEKKMKKYLILAIAAAAVLALVGCGKKETSETKKQEVSGVYFGQPIEEFIAIFEKQYRVEKKDASWQSNHFFICWVYENDEELFSVEENPFDPDDKLVYGITIYSSTLKNEKGIERIDADTDDMMITIDKRIIARNASETATAQAAETPEGDDGSVDFGKLTLKGDVYYLNNEPFTGTAKKVDETSDETWEMKDGKFHGKYIGDSPNGSVTGYYKDGKKHGEWIEFQEPYDTYNKKIETYKDGKKHGEWKYIRVEQRWEGEEVKFIEHLIKTETYENDKLIKEWTKQTENDASETIDISTLWGNERDFFGQIGSKKQKMGIVFLSTDKFSEAEEEQGIYKVIGKSKVKNNICDFEGVMAVQHIGFENDAPNVVNEIKGIFHFYEDKNQSNTGEFEGEFLISWYENYDIYLDIGSGRPDVYNKDSRLPTVVDFRGTWKGYNSAVKSTVHWGNEEHIFPGSWNDGQEFTLAKNYREIGWGPFFDREDSDEETRKKAEEEYQKLWVNWWK